MRPLRGAQRLVQSARGLAATAFMSRPVRLGPRAAAAPAPPAAPLALAAGGSLALGAFHQRQQHAFAQTAVGNAQARRRPQREDRLEDRKARDHEFGALRPDARMRRARLAVHRLQLRDDAQDVVALAATGRRPWSARSDRGPDECRRSSSRCPRCPACGTCPAGWRPAAQGLGSPCSRAFTSRDHLVVGAGRVEPAREASRPSVTTPSGIEPQRMIRGARARSRRSSQISSVEPPPMSKTSAPASLRSSSGVTPRAASRASSSGRNDVEVQAGLLRDALDEVGSVARRAAGFGRDGARAGHAALAHLHRADADRLDRARDRGLRQFAGLRSGLRRDARCARRSRARGSPRPRAWRSRSRQLFVPRSSAA